MGWASKSDDAMTLGVRVDCSSCHVDARGVGGSRDTVHGAASRVPLRGLIPKQPRLSFPEQRNLGIVQHFPTAQGPGGPKYSGPIARKLFGIPVSFNIRPLTVPRYELRTLMFNLLWRQIVSEKAPSVSYGNHLSIMR